MKEPWRVRLAKRVCRIFGHRERQASQGGVYCARCMLLLRGGFLSPRHEQECREQWARDAAS